MDEVDEVQNAVKLPQFQVSQDFAVSFSRKRKESRNFI